MKITVVTPKPRNPFVAASHMRRAGSHRSGGSATRQEGRRTLKRELAQLAHRQDSP